MKLFFHDKFLSLLSTNATNRSRISCSIYLWLYFLQHVMSALGFDSILKDVHLLKVLHKKQLHSIRIILPRELSCTPF